MLTSLFDYDLPPERIAQHPVSPRDASRLLVVGQQLEDRHFRDLPSLLRPGDLLVLNDSKVIPARLRGKRNDANVEMTLFKAVDGKIWKILAKPAKRLSVGDVVRFGGGFTATVLEKSDDGFITVRFTVGGADLIKALQHFGMPPLPPYIKRDRNGALGEDKQTYQTIYAKHEGSIAAPTAGLHFTPSMMEALKAHDIHTATVTLHVGGGTFLPVKAEDTYDHVMHAEFGCVPEETARTVNETRRRGGRIVAVGTTALRTLESAANDDGSLRAWSGETSIFITPGYRFKCVDLLLSNFHLPRSTLFMLVCAFSGIERMKAAYAHAIASDYRFYSYGDACLLHRCETAAIS